MDREELVEELVIGCNNQFTENDRVISCQLEAGHDSRCQAIYLVDQGRAQARASWESAQAQAHCDTLYYILGDETRCQNEITHSLNDGKGRGEIIGYLCDDCVREAHPSRVKKL